MAGDITLLSPWPDATEAEADFARFTHPCLAVSIDSDQAIPATLKWTGIGSPLTKARGRSAAFWDLAVSMA
jgi:hypothetical protein